MTDLETSFHPTDDTTLTERLNIKPTPQTTEELIDFDMRTRNPNFSQSHVKRERERIRQEIGSNIL